MTVFIAMDSFKGSMTSEEANHHVARAFQEEGFSTVTQVVADGGEGSVAAFIHQGAQSVLLSTVDSLKRPIQAEVAYLPSERTVVIETASASGIQFGGHPLETSSYGTGQLIKEAIQTLNIDNVILMLGGTGTIDGGIGMGEALGVQYYHHQTKLTNVTGKDLKQITHIDDSLLKRQLNGIHFFVGSDVTAPLTGPMGAVYNFGPQKGLHNDECDDYEQMMLHYAQLISTNLHEGDGAAGGIGFFCRHFLNAEFQSGFQYIYRHHAIDPNSIDFVITGEGRCDHQTWLGKLPSQIIHTLAKPTFILTGQNQTILSQVPSEVKGIYSIIQDDEPLEEILSQGPTWLYITAKQLARTLSWALHKT